MILNVVLTNCVLFCFPLSGRANPECMLGHLLKILFKNDDFMNAVRNMALSTGIALAFSVVLDQGFSNFL